MAQEPKVLGHYRIERTLGKGAMGVVYEGLDLRLHRKVAIKTIIKAGQGDTLAQEYTNRFLREAQAVARLNHPNIVHVYDFGEEEDISYIVMELINGRDLKSVLEAKERFELKETLRIICELLDGLDFAHAAGVVHRDIKPANMMFDAQRRVKLTDFGVARLTDVERTRVELTQAGTMVGTPAYMSPEQVQGLTVDHRTDIFSAGVVLYQLLTGQKPFEGGAFTVAKRIVESEPPPPSAYERSISPELDRVVARALAKQPDQRFPRAKEFATALQRIYDPRPAFASDEDATVIAPPRPISGDPPPTRPESTSSTRGGMGHGNEADIEFWRTIKDSNDVEDLEFYVQRFPEGIYVDLAKRKIAKLKQGGPARPATDETSPRGRNLDEEFWRGVKESDDAEDFELYVERFPKGIYVDLAKRKIARLRASTGGDEGGMRGRNLDEELWRGVRDSTDVADIEHYLDRFPQGLYVDLARRKIAKLRGAPGSEDSSAIIRRADVDAGRRAEEERQAAEKARQEAEAQAKREADEKARQEAEAKARREAEEKARQEAEARAKREAEEKARQEAEAKARREAEEKARKEAEAKAKRDAEEKAALLEAQAKAKREAEEKARREAEAKAKRDAEEKARQEAEAKAKREAEEKARRDAEARAKRESEENARKLAEAKALREAEEQARREAEQKAKREAEKAKREAENRARVGMAATSDAIAAPAADKPEGKSPMGLIIGGVVALAVIGGGAYFMFKPKPEATPVTPPPVATPPAAEKPAPPPVTEPPKKKAEEVVAPPPTPAPAPAPVPEKAAPVTAPPPAAKPAEQKADTARRDAEMREAAKRAAESRARLEAAEKAEKAKREAEDKARSESNAKQLEEERKAAQARIDEERKKLREEEQRINEMRKRNEEAAQKQRQDAERAEKARAEAEKAKEDEKKKARVFVPPTF